MALESCGTITAKMIDNAFKACHDLVKDEADSREPNIQLVDFVAGQKGLWKVVPSILDGKFAVEIRIVVG